MTADLTLRGLFTSALDRFGDAACLTAAGRTLSYRDLVRQANGLADFLHRSGIGPGVPVALLLSNGIEYVVADQAVLRAGGAKVPLNDLLGPRDIAHILADSGAVVAISGPTQLEQALIALADPATSLTTLIVVDGPTEALGAVSWSTAVGPGADSPPEIVVSADDIGLIMYTGGTTGLPKGVVHVQSRLALNILAHVIEIGLGDDERLLITTALPHSSGFHLQAGLLKGAHTFLESTFSPALVLHRIEHDRVTFLFAVPTMIYRLLDHVAEVAADRTPDFTTLRTILYGAAPITPERLTQGLETFGPVFMQLYGQSEAPNFITRLSRGEHDPAHPELLTSCGRPVTLARVRIVDEDGTDCPVGSVGEVIAHTPYTMVGYHGLPEKTAQTLRDGWLYTGDLGRLDADGYLYLVDRKNDLIITGGMNVYSSEVENVIAEVPGVAQVAVVGLPDPDWGEAVTAFVIGSVGETIDTAAVLRHCKAQLNRYKVPKAVHVVDALPLTSVGKLDKKALRVTTPDHRRSEV